uniref:Uncharacterized protein n=1 Tax=Romanomermis culicivorax TaxID=13658 RepID=A0A915KWT3_ROMCU
MGAARRQTSTPWSKSSPTGLLAPVLRACLPSKASENLLISSPFMRQKLRKIEFFIKTNMSNGFPVQNNLPHLQLPVKTKGALRQQTMASEINFYGFPYI